VGSGGTAAYVEPGARCPLRPGSRRTAGPLPRSQRVRCAAKTPARPCLRPPHSAARSSACPSYGSPPLVPCREERVTSTVRSATPRTYPSLDILRPQASDVPRTDSRQHLTSRCESLGTTDRSYPRDIRAGQPAGVRIHDGAVRRPLPERPLGCVRFVNQTMTLFLERSRIRRHGEARRPLSVNSTQPLR